MIYTSFCKKIQRLSFVACLLLAGCSSTPDNNEAVPSDYPALIERFSDGEADFDGLQNSFQYRGTIMNRLVSEAINNKKAQYFQWTPAQLSEETEKANQEMSHSTKVFVSFFTPKHENDNLTNASSIWKIYLDVNGVRYAGKAQRSSKLIDEMKTLFPYHNRWSTGYWIDFPVPTASVEGYPSTLTITGPLGVREIKFRPLIH